MKIAFVTPFFGELAAGGAESECRNTAIRLAQRGLDVEILTTCLLDLQHDWNISAYEAGASEDNGLTVRRFRADKVDRLAFDRLNALVMSGQNVSPEQGEQFASMHINSSDLLRYLADHADEYDWVCFIPYLFGTSIHASKLCPDKTILIPCLHDEGYARITPVRDMFKRTARVVFHTKAEEELASKLYGETSAEHLVIGEGIDTDLVANADRFRSTHQIKDPFILYCGRKDSSKNTPEMIQYFAQYTARNDNDLKLVMIGPGTVEIPASAGNRIIDLGFVSKQDKLDAYAAASVFCQPSLNESFSIVLMESWDVGRPALVNGACRVMKDHVVESGGGLYYHDAKEFDATLNYLLSNPDMAERMGLAGRKYVRNNFAWDRVIDRFLERVF